MFKAGDYVIIKTEIWDLHHNLTGTVLCVHDNTEQHCTIKLDKKSILEIEKRCERINQNFYTDFKYPAISSDKLCSNLLLF